MTLLQVMPDDDPAAVLVHTDDAEVITAHLARLGVAFDRRATVPLPDTADPATVLALYAEDVGDLVRTHGFDVVDVAMLRPCDDPDWPQRAANARATFRTEHRHDEDEVRLFVHGSGCFYLHIGRFVHAVVCTAGDLLAVPRGTAHWFDTGAEPDFAAIRFFEDEDGWVGRFDPASIAAAFPSLDDLRRPDPAPV